MRIEHLEHLFLVFLLDTDAGILHYKNYLLLNSVVVNIHEDMAFLGVLNGVRYNIKCYLQHPLLVTDHLLWQYLISVKFSHIFKYRSAFNLLVQVVKQLLYLLNFNKLDKHLVLVGHLREVGVEQECKLLFKAA
jgi:hypothetical protein